MGRYLEMARKESADSFRELACARTRLAEALEKSPSEAVLVLPQFRRAFSDAATALEAQLDIEPAPAPSPRRIRISMAAAQWLWVTLWTGFVILFTAGYWAGRLGLQ
jgi:hypothetical protein